MTTKYVEISYCDCCGEDKPIIYCLRVVDCNRYVGSGDVLMELCEDCGKKIVSQFEQKKIEAENKYKNTWRKNQ